MDPDAPGVERVGLVAETQQEHAAWQRLLERLDGTDVDELREILQSVSQMRRKLAVVERERALASTTLDRLQLGIVIAGTSGRILLINDTARELLSADNGLSDIDGFLKAESASEHRLLIGLIEAACIGAESDKPLRISKGGENNGSLEVVVRSADQGAIVAIADPEHRPEGSPKLLRGLYSLTPTEAKVAALLVEGGNSKDIAKALGVGVETIRTHIKHILSKTGCHRQVDLVRRLVTGPGGLRPRK